MISEDIIRVHVENADDLKVSLTEEKEPEHFSLYTVVVASNLTGYDNYEEILPLDPLRKDASILAVDQPVVLCASQSELTDPANQVSGTPYPQGAYLPAGDSLAITGTGRMWVVATTGSASRVSVFVNRRSR